MAVKEKKPEVLEKEANLPTTMHAAAIDRFGGAEILTMHTLPVPEIDRGEVLIAVDTAGVGVWDGEMRAGWVPGGHPTFPLILGTDGSGKVVAMGSHIRRFKLGDAVYSYSFYNPKGGFYGEYVAVMADKVALLPRGLGLREAGAIPTTGLTALQGIDDALEVKRDEAVLIHGGSGGVGTLAVQFVKLRGARVFATASGADGVDLVRRLGADAAVDGRHEDIEGAARQFASEGMDAVLGLVGGEALDSCVKSIRSGGRLAYPNGVKPKPKKRPGIRVFTYDAVANAREFERLAMAIEAVKLQVPIAAAFSLGDAGKAHERIAEGHVLGKIVLRTGAAT
jgi:NADPH:quinone reductase-like Zn-dependent oxidoreductase